MAPPIEVRTSLRMPAELHRQLTRAAEANGNSFSDEVRHRLTVSLELGADAKTHSLLVAIGKMAARLADWCGPWHDNGFAATTFLRAVEKLIVLRTPNWMGEEETSTGTARIRPKPGSPGIELFQPSATVTNVSSALVASVQSTGGEG